MAGPCSPAVCGESTGVHLAVFPGPGWRPTLGHQCCWVLAESSAGGRRIRAMSHSPWEEDGENELREVKAS